MKCDVRWLVLIAALGLAGCPEGGGGGGNGSGGGGGQGNGPGPETPAPVDENPEESSNAFPADKATGVVSGKILFDGDPPPREQVKDKDVAAAKDDFCEKHHGGNPILKEDLIVSEDKAIRNVVVHVKSFPQEWEHAVPEEPVMVTQKDCVYIPHVLGVMAKQPVIVTSDDATTHNVHIVSKMQRIRTPNFAIAKEEKRELAFTRPELGTAFFKCDIHGWMKSYVGVFDHPFFAVTGDDGTYELGKLPPGEYEIEAWHEKLGTQKQTITVTDGETTAVDFTFKQE